MPFICRPELVTMPPVFTPVRTSRFWDAVLDCVHIVQLPTELALTAHLKGLAEYLDVQPKDTTRFGYLVGLMIGNHSFHHSYGREHLVVWGDMRTMPVGYIRTFMRNIEKPFGEGVYETLVTLHPAGIDPKYSGALNVTWRNGRGSLMSMAEAGADPELVKSYWGRSFLTSATSATMQALGAGQVPGDYAEQMLAETKLSGSEIAAAWEAGLPLEYVKAMEAA